MSHNKIGNTGMAMQPEYLELMAEDTNVQRRMRGVIALWLHQAQGLSPDESIAAAISLVQKTEEADLLTFKRDDLDNHIDTIVAAKLAAAQPTITRDQLADAGLVTREFAVRNPHSGNVITVPDGSLENAHKMAALVPSTILTRTVSEWIDYK
jgi:hypothetical protein